MKNFIFCAVLVPGKCINEASVDQKFYYKFITPNGKNGHGNREERVPDEPQHSHHSYKS